MAEETKNGEAEPVEEPPAVDPLREALDGGEEVEDVTPEVALTAYRGVLDADRDDDAGHKIQEEGVYKLAKLLTKLGRNEAVMQLLIDIRPFCARIPKAKTAKIIRNIIDIVGKVGQEEAGEGGAGAGSPHVALQISLCESVIAWCREERRTFLRQRCESRLCSLYYQVGRYGDAMNILKRLLREVKKMDDKPMLVEAHLVESRVQHALRNTPKAKAALTAARANSNSIYVAPLLQAEIDNQSGTLHCEEGDYKTSYSYFFEAFEVYSNLNDDRAIRCLMLMMMCKILQGDPKDVQGIIAGKYGSKYATSAAEHLTAMAAIGRAAEKRDLQQYLAAAEAHDALLKSDVLVEHHLGVLHEKLLEDNIAKVIEPFSRVEISRVAELIDLPLATVESKLSQMILDKKFEGILDQGRGQLIIYNKVETQKTFDLSLEVITNMGNVVDSLFRRADRLQR